MSFNDSRVGDDEQNRGTNRVNPRRDVTQETHVTPRAKRSKEPKWNTDGSEYYNPKRKTDKDGPYYSPEYDSANPFDLLLYPFRLFERHRNAITFIVGLAIIGILFYLVTNPNIVVNNLDGINSEIGEIKRVLAHTQTVLNQKVSEAEHRALVEKLENHMGQMSAELKSYVKRTEFLDTIKTIKPSDNVAEVLKGQLEQFKKDEKARVAAAIEEYIKSHPVSSGGSSTGGLTRDQVIAIVKGEIAHLNVGGGRPSGPISEHERNVIVNLVVDKITKDPNFLSSSVINQILSTLTSGGVERPDYALASAGAAIWAKGTTPSIRATGVIGFLSQHLLPQKTSPVLQPDNSPGKCHCFSTPRGNISIVLAEPIIVDAITIDHVNPKIAFNIASAPQAFRILGYKTKKDKPVELGFGTFKKPEGADDIVQQFPVNNADDSVYQIVTVSFENNHGANHTCIYRIRVHARGK